MKTLLRNKWVRLVAVLTLFSVYCLVMTLTVGTPCPMRYLTGFPCPACGMTRANLLAIRLDFAGAFRMHPLFFYSYLLAAAAVAFTARPDWALKKTVAGAAIALTAVFVAVYIYRMVAFYPAAEPLAYNWRSLLGLVRKRWHF